MPLYLFLDQIINSADHGVGRCRPLTTPHHRTSAVVGRLYRLSGLHRTEFAGLSIGKDAFFAPSLCQAHRVLGRNLSPPAPDNSADRVTARTTPATGAGIGGRDFGYDLVLEGAVKVESSLGVSATIESQHFDRLILIDKYPPSSFIN